MTTPLALLRSTAPHAGLAALSRELWAAYERLPKALRLALVAWDNCPRTSESALAAGIACMLSDDLAWSEAMKLARAALRETRGILSPDGKVSR